MSSSALKSAEKPSLCLSKLVKPRGLTWPDLICFEAADEIRPSMQSLNFRSSESRSLLSEERDVSAPIASAVGCVASSMPDVILSQAFVRTKSVRQRS